MQNKSFRSLALPLSALFLGFSGTASRADVTDPVNELARYNNVDWLLGGVGALRDYPNFPGEPAIQLSLGNANAVLAGSIQQAYLYWGGPSDINVASAVPSISFQGNALTGTSLGVGFGNFAGYETYQAYRADVTSILAGGFGAGATFSVENLLNYGGGEVNVSGASLMVIFNDGNAFNNRDLVLFDGNDSNGSPEDGYAWHVSLANINYAGGAANLYIGVGDGDPEYEDGQLFLNGQFLFPNEFNGSILGSGADTAGFWDLAGYDISGILAPGSNNVLLDSVLYNDYTSLIHGFVDMPSAEQPVPEPATVISGVAFAALAAGRLLRKKK